MLSLIIFYDIQVYRSNMDDVSNVSIIWIIILVNLNKKWI
jgi:hypothetical protein